MTNVTKSCTDLCRCNGFKQTCLCYRQQIQCFLRNISNRKRSGIISNETVQSCPNVYADDVAGFDHTMPTWNAVNDFFIDGDTRTCGKPAVSEKRRGRTAVNNEIMQNLIQLVSCHPRMDGFSCKFQCLCGNTSRFSQFFQIASGFNCNH